MVQLSDIFDRELYSRMVEEKYVRGQRHPSLPLAIVNYTELAQFRREWNEVTLNCRGLIWDFTTEEVVARGFKKFFNWDDSSQPFPPTGPVLRSPKMDGSLGILYSAGEDIIPRDGRWMHQWAVATRGSFASDQALWANSQIWKMHDRGDIDLRDLDPAKSYLVEIIYPENRIVVDYGTSERLTLLDVLDTATGTADLGEFDRVFWSDKVEKISIPGFKDTMASDIPGGEEGFVFYWPQKDFRVKMKAAEYIELHRMIFSLSARTVWERMGNGETVEDICVKLPDEFHDWVKNIGAGLTAESVKREIEARKEYLNIQTYLCDGVARPTRASFAKVAVGSPNKGLLFMLYDGKEIWDEIWKDLRPAGNIGVKTISEDVA